MAIKIKNKSNKKKEDDTEKEESGQLPPPENKLEKEIEDAVIISPDRFQTAAFDGVDWAAKHTSTLIAGVLVIIVLAGASYFLLSFLEDRKTQMSSELNPVFQANAAMIKGSPEYKALEDEKPKFTIPSYDTQKEREEVILKTALTVTRDAKDDPISVPALLAEASAQLKLGEPAKAEVSYQRLLKLNHDKNVSIMANFGLYEAFADQKKYDDALKTLEDVEKQDESVAKKLRYTKATLLEEMGKKDEAKALYQAILDDKAAGTHQSDIERRLAEL